MATWNIESPTTEYYDHLTPGIEAVIREVVAAPEVAIDTETTGLVLWKDIPLYWSLAWGNRRMTLNVSALHLFAEAFNDPNKRWILANAKYDAHILANVGVILAGKLVDICVMHALLYDDRPHGLKEVNQHLFGWKWQDFQDTFGRITKTNTPTDIIRRAEQESFPLLCEYAANDAWGTLQVYEEMKKQLKRAVTHSLFRGPPLCIETLWDLFDKIEVPYTKVLWRTERKGVLVNTEHLHSIAPTAVAEIEELERSICKEAGTYINPKSPKQLREYFFDKLGLTPLKVSKGGKTGIKTPSTDIKFLEQYQYDVPMAEMLIRHRELTKLHGTYILGLSSHLDPHGRIHSRFNQDVTRCMPAGELVLTNRGYIPVQDVVVGDKVITHTGSTKPITEVSAHAPKPIYRVLLYNGLVLRTTGNHEYCTGNSWTRADKLTPEQSVAVHSDKEQWRVIPGWEQFEVSSWGRVRNTITGCVRKLQPKGKWEHLEVTLYRSGRGRNSEDKKDFAVHQLVLAAFGPAGQGEARHTNGIAWDNTARNFMGSRASFYTARVVSVEVEQPEKTYGLTVADDHSHVTGGVVTHNTGRLSSSSPNLQNIPKPENDKWKLRGAFIAPPGYKLSVVDYEQLEMRLLAAASGEQGMLDVIAKGWDIHMGNASMIFDIPYDEIEAAKKTPEDQLTARQHECLAARAAAKNIGFGIIYGMGPKKLAGTLGVSMGEAQAKIKMFKQTYPAVDAFTKEAVEETRQTGYAFTILGRRRNLPAIASHRNSERMQAERQAVNTQIQGSSADVVKMAQILLDKSGIRERFGAEANLQVHDELMHEIPIETAVEAEAEIKEWMEHPFPSDLLVHLGVDGNLGDSWSQAK